MRPNSQAARILTLLRERPHTTSEILREVPSIVHSRIAQLRELGYVIACDRTKGYGAGAFRYTLLSEPDPGDHGADVRAGSLSGVDYSVVTGKSDHHHEEHHAQQRAVPAAHRGEGRVSPELSSHADPDPCAAQLSLIDEAA